MDGTGAVGTTTKYAREDHKHPTDTSREAIIAAGTTAQYWRGDKAWQTLDKAAVGLGNVDNTSDASKPVSTATTTALNLKEDKASKGVVNGYASLDAGAKVPAAQLPSYVDDVLEYANLAAFPGSGTTGIIYVALDTNKVYRWSGSAYVEISPSPGSSDAVPEGSVNLYYTAARSALKADLASPTFTGDPRAPTPATADNDTSIATTAHVQANMALKANVSHTHAESDVTNLVSDLALHQQPLSWGDLQNPLALLPHQPSANDCPLLVMQPGAEREVDVLVPVDAPQPAAAGGAAPVRPRASRR
jgi:hypothetical protein